MKINRLGYSALVVLCAISSSFLFQNCNRSFSTEKSSHSMASQSEIDGMTLGLNLLAYEKPTPQFGMIYSILHCMANQAPHNTVIGDAKKTGRWGPLSTIHWRDRPTSASIENYCLARNPQLAAKHLNLLKDAGVSFLVVDFTNQCSAEGEPEIPGCAVASREMMQSFDVLLNTAAGIAGAPKIVAWLPFKGTLLAHVVSKMDSHPSTNYIYNQKPLIIAAWDKAREFHIGVQERILQLRTSKEVRRMWGMTGAATASEGPDMWSFMEICQSGFRESQGNQDCNQYGSSEMTSVSVAYQETFMTIKETATPKFQGRTMIKQLETAMRRQSSVILFNSWNEWIAQRFCYQRTDFQVINGVLTCAPGVPEFGPNGEVTFVDLFDGDYNRDLEPDSTGDGYYQLLKRALSVVKNPIPPVEEPVRPVPLPVPTPVPAPAPAPVVVPTPVPVQSPVVVVPQPAPTPSIPSGYSQVESVNASTGNVAGQTGSWWCENHFGRNLGGKWDCIGGNCNSTVAYNEKIDCGKVVFTTIQAVYASIGNVAGQTGNWWCVNHFGRNLGGTWVCLGGFCDTDVQLNQKIECGRR